MTEKRVDQDWKRRAQEAKQRAASEAQARGQQVEPSEPSFTIIVSSFVAQALIALGEIQAQGAERHIDLEAAKFTIDLLQVLQEKTKGNLTPEETKLLANALYDLRMRYVQASS